MNLTPGDVEKLLLVVAGNLARDRRERGIKLNHPEAIALLTTWVLERAREGSAVADLMVSGRTVLGPDDVMAGVAEMIHDVQVEATFPDGRKLVTVHDPIGAADPEGPGAVRVAPGTVLLNEGRETLALVVENTGDRPVQIGSHLHLPDANTALLFDRAAAIGFHLDIPSGTSIRFEPGVTREVTAVRLAGAGRVPGIQIREGAN